MGGRAPHGARGLKSCKLVGIIQGWKSRPAWGAWIEIKSTRHNKQYYRVAPRMGRVD